jgi:exosome complex component RRP43
MPSEVLAAVCLNTPKKQCLVQCSSNDHHDTTCSSVLLDVSYLFEINLVISLISSCCVPPQVGTSTVLAGVRLEVMIPSSEAPADGQVIINVEMTALATPDYKPGKQPPITHSIQQRLQEVLLDCKVLQLSELCIAEGRAVWVLYLDLYITNAAGGLLDASLLAALAALQDTRLPNVHVTDEGNVERGAAEDDEDAAAAAAGDSGADAGSSRPLHLHGWPLALTCGVYNGQHIVADPDHEEEALMSASISVVLDTSGELLGELA